MEAEYLVILIANISSVASNVAMRSKYAME